MFRSKLLRQFAQLALLLGSVLVARPLVAATREPFESGEPSWRLVEKDCEVVIGSHKRTMEKPHAGQSCELLQLTAGQGTKILVAHDIGQARVIPELVPSVWVRSNRTGIQLFARVVFPRSADPKTGKPLTRLIQGSSYSDVGGWQRLSITDVERLVLRQVQLLRTQFEVDDRESYLDLVVLNVYSGPGAISVWIDDLEIEGHVTNAATNVPLAWSNVSTVGSAQAVAFAEPADTAPVDEVPTIQRQGSVLEVAGRPFFARVIEHNGESFEWLGSLGFNVIALAAPATDEQLQDAQRLGIWLVAPPPHVAGRRRITDDHNCIFAWRIGEHLAWNQLEPTRELAVEVQRSDPRSGRPLVCGADSQLWEYSRVADVLHIDLEPLGGSFELSQFDAWLRERARLARTETPFWAGIQTEPPQCLVDQIAAAISDPPPIVSVEPQQIRLMALRAVAAGARGLFFRSRSRLDVVDAPTKQRAVALQALNLELNVIEPWAAGGSVVDQLETSDPAVRVAVLQTERSRLLLVLRDGSGQQHVMGPVSSRAVSFEDAGGTALAQAYEIDRAAGLTPLSDARRPGSVRVTLRNVVNAAMVVLTQDPLVVNHLAKQTADNYREAARLRYELAAQQLSTVNEILRQLPNATPAASGATFQSLVKDEVQANLARAKDALESGDARTSHLYLERAEQGAAKVRRAIWDQAAGGFSTSTSSPFCSFFATLPVHAQVAQRLPAAQWSANALAGGDFEDLDHMRRSGWRHQRDSQSPLVSQVELSPEIARSGRAALRIRVGADANATAPVAIESAPVWVTSAPVPVVRGQMVRIHGWVRLPQGVSGSRDGLLIADTIGGLALAHRIREAPQWQEFALYRVAPSNGEISVTFAMTGIGEAWLDDVSILLVQPPTDASTRR